jgi:mannose-6-phosphate isomerase-like protein (cupin superfamily)
MNEPRKISAGQTDDFDKEGFSGHVYVSPEGKEGFNALTVDVHGRHPRKRMVDTTRVYFVIEGSGTFTLGDEVTQVENGDTFVIPPGGEYEYEGQMRLFEFNVSPDNSFKEEILE